MDWMSVVGGVGSLFGSIGNALFGQSQSKDLMRYQASLNQRAIDTQNRYNSPAEQMRRLREASLNPNLVYGSGVDGNTSAAATVSQSNRNPQLDSGVLDAINTFFKRQQLRNETAVSESSAQLNKATTALRQADTLVRMIEAARKHRTFDSDVAQAAENVRKTQTEIAAGEQGIEESKQRVVESQQRVENLKETVNEIKARVRNLDARTITERLRPSEVRAHIKLMKEQAGTTAKQRELYDSIIRLNDEKIAQLSLLYEKLGYETQMSAIELTMHQGMQKFGLTGWSWNDFGKFLLDLLKVALK